MKKLALVLPVMAIVTILKIGNFVLPRATLAVPAEPKIMAISDDLPSGAGSSTSTTSRPPTARKFRKPTLPANIDLGFAPPPIVAPPNLLVISDGLLEQVRALGIEVEAVAPDDQPPGSVDPALGAEDPAAAHSSGSNEGVPLQDDPEATAPRLRREDPSHQAPYDGGMFERRDAEDEIIASRGRHSKHFRNPDGSITAIISGRPVHYEVATRDWRDIRTDIRANRTGNMPEYAYAVPENRHELYLGDTINTGYLIRLPEGDLILGQQAELHIEAADGEVLLTVPRSPSPGEPRTNRLVYLATYPGLAGHDELAVLPRGVKHSIVLQNRVASVARLDSATHLVLREFVGLPAGWVVVPMAHVVAASAPPEKSESLAVLDDAGALVAAFPTPSVREKNIRTVEHHDGPKGASVEYRIEEVFGFYRVETTPGGIMLDTVLPVSWLLHPDRRYPLVIDPTVTAGAQNSYPWTGYWRNGSCYSGSSQAGDLVKWQGADTAYGWMYFDTSSIPDGSSITSTVLRFYAEQVNYPYYTIRKMSTFTNTCSTLRGYCTGGSLYQQVNEPSSASPGWRTIDLGSSADADLQSRLTANYFGVGFRDTDTSDSYYLYATGWRPPFIHPTWDPEIDVIFTDPNQPPDVDYNTQWPSTMYAGQSYTIRTNHWDPNGRSDVDRCLAGIGVNHAWDIQMEFDPVNNSYSVTNGSSIITLNSVTKSNLTNGYRITWAITPNWSWSSGDDSGNLDPLAGTYDNAGEWTGYYWNNNYDYENDVRMTNVNYDTTPVGNSSFTVTGYVDYEGVTSPTPPNVFDIRIDPAWTSTNYDDYSLSSSGQFSIDVQADACCTSSSFDIDFLAYPSGAGHPNSNGLPVTFDGCAAQIVDAWWSNEVDVDGDGCKRSARLRWDSDVAGCSCSLSVYEKVYWKPWWDPFWHEVDTTTAHTITGCSSSDEQYMDLFFDSDCGVFEWKIEVYQVGQSSPDDSRDHGDDADLDDHKEERASPDDELVPPTLVELGCYVSPTSAEPGDTINFYYRIDNPNAVSLDVGLGASIRLNGTSTWTSDLSCDTHVTTPPGTSDHSRCFHLPADACGSYDAAFGIWETIGQGSPWDGLEKLSEFVVVPDPCLGITTISDGVRVSGTLGTCGGWANYTDCPRTEPGEERVYEFTTTLMGTYTLTVSQTGGDPDFFLLSNCDNASVNLLGACWGDGVRTTELSAGTTYYIVVDNSSDSSDAGYTLQVNYPCESDIRIEPTMLDIEACEVGGGGSWRGRLPDDDRLFAERFRELLLTPERQGQDPCGTMLDYWAWRHVAGPQQRDHACSDGNCDEPADRDAAIPTPSTPIKTFRVRFHVFGNDDGTNYVCTQNQIDTVVAQVNTDHFPWRAQFAVTTRFVDDSTYRDLESSEVTAMKNLYNESPQTQLNIYVCNFVGDLAPWGGFGTFPWDSRATGPQGGIYVDADNLIVASGHLLTHEIGHCVGLWHTFHGVDPGEVAQCSTCYERADGQDADITGDLCSDTRPTPKNSHVCGNPGGTDPCTDTDWGETPYRNYMSYSSCRSEYTAQQAGRTHCWAEDVLSGWIEQTFAIFNDGCGPLNVISIVGEGASCWLSVTPAPPYSIGAGDSQMVAVHIDEGCVSPGAYTDRLLVHSDDPDESPYPSGVYVNLTLNSNPTPTITVTPATTVCYETMVTLDAGPGHNSYLWSPDGQTAQTIHVTLPETTTYCVTVTDAGGCEGTDCATVTAQDDVPPTLTCPTSLNVPADPGSCEATNVDLGEPVTDDNCGVDSVTNDAPASFPIGTTIVTWTVMDTGGNSANCTQNVTVAGDAEDPTITCPANVTVECGDSIDPADTGEATVTDNCDLSPEITFGDSSSGSCLTVLTRTWTAIDASGNSDSCEQTITVQDITSPVITACAADKILSAGGACEATVPDLIGEVAAIDNCDQILTITQTPPAGTPIGAGDTDVTIVVADDCGNTAECSATVMVIDDTSPTITCPQDVTGSVDSGSCEATNVELGTPMTDDNCGVDSVTNDAPASFPIGTTIVTWTVMDTGGNSATCTQGVTVAGDAEAPAVTCPADVSVECGDSISPADTGEATVTDNCDPSPEITSNDSSSGACPTLLTRTWTATDASGNISSCDQIITLEDTTSPAIMCPPALTIECGDSTDPADTGTAMASDECDANPTTTFTDGSSGSCPLVMTRTWTVTDVCGNTDSCEQTITVQDTTAPVITACAEDKTLSADGACEAAVPELTGEVAATDNCDQTLTITQTPPTGTVIGAGDTEVTMTVADDCGNTTECSATVTVVDDTPPTVTCPQDVTIAADPGSCDATNVELGTPITDDNCGVANVANDALASFPAGTTTVTWTVVDTSGNTATCIQTVTVTGEDEAPTITCPTDVTLECADSTNPSDTGEATATDNCDPSPVITFSDSAAGSCPLVITRAWTATDAFGNSSSCDQVLTVQDTTAPVITGCAGDRTLPADANCQARLPDLTGAVVADDACDEGVTITQSPLADTPLGLGESRVTITVADDCGNEAICAVTVTVVDETPPSIITCPADLVIPANENLIALVPDLTGELAATDNCDDDLTITQEPAAGTQIGCEGTEVRLTVTDDVGLTNSCQSQITVLCDPPGGSVTVLTVGEGTVRKDPDKEIYEAGEAVLVTPIPAVGWRFERWEGDVSGTDTPMTLTVSEGDVAVTAIFQRSPCLFPPAGDLCGICLIPLPIVVMFSGLCLMKGSRRRRAS